MPRSLLARQPDGETAPSPRDAAARSSDTKLPPMKIHRCPEGCRRLGCPGLRPDLQLLYLARSMLVQAVLWLPPSLHTSYFAQLGLMQTCIIVCARSSSCDLTQSKHEGFYDEVHVLHLPVGFEPVASFRVGLELIVASALLAPGCL